MLAPPRTGQQRAPSDPATPRWLQGLDDDPLFRRRARRPGRGGRGRRSGRRPTRTGAWRRARRIALIAAALVMVPAVVSYASMLTQRSDSTLSIRTVEWLRDNGLRGLVN